MDAFQRTNPRLFFGSKYVNIFFNKNKDILHQGKTKQKQINHSSWQSDPLQSRSTLMGGY